MKIAKLSVTFVAAAFAVELDPERFSSTIMVDDGQIQMDFIATALAQARWSRRAAIAAGTSTIFQAIALLLAE
jgi:hypothetical protein